MADRRPFEVVAGWLSMAGSTVILALASHGRDPVAPVDGSRASLPPDERVVAEPDEGQFTALPYFTPDGTDHRSHEEQNSMIRRHIAWRSRHKDNEALRDISRRAKGCLTRH